MTITSINFGEQTKKAESIAYAIGKPYMSGTILSVNNTSGFNISHNGYNYMTKDSIENYLEFVTKYFEDLIAGATVESEPTLHYKERCNSILRKAYDNLEIPRFASAVDKILKDYTPTKLMLVDKVEHNLHILNQTIFQRIEILFLYGEKIPSKENIVNLDETSLRNIRSLLNRKKCTVENTPKNLRLENLIISILKGEEVEWKKKSVSILDTVSVVSHGNYELPINDKPCDEYGYRPVDDPENKSINLQLKEKKVQYTKNRVEEDIADFTEQVDRQKTLRAMSMHFKETLKRRLKLLFPNEDVRQENWAIVHLFEELTTHLMHTLESELELQARLKNDELGIANLFAEKPSPLSFYIKEFKAQFASKLLKTYPTITIQGENGEEIIQKSEPYVSARFQRVVIELFNLDSNHDDNFINNVFSLFNIHLED
ncbi:MAG: hypothetical protein WC222_06710 [Parachlamydiales bacterium]|jgi:hypothetical protein